ncbi:CBS domain-containing protein [Candidatus Saccharibacteria bacterium]|nr:CBS domain-containing protein [Candidatus Saccharibacteria bacterium]
MIAVIVLMILYTGVVFLVAVRPRRSELSVGELERRVKRGSGDAEEVLRREKLLPDVMVLRNFKLMVVGLAFVGIAVGVYGVWLGIFVMMMAMVGVMPLSRVRILRRLVAKLYESVEWRVLNFVEKFGGVFRVFREFSEEFASVRVSSREELEEVIATAGSDVISDEEKTIMMSAARFGEKKVADVMVVKDEVFFVGVEEVLTPMVLDKLHKTGFAQFPVIGGGVDEVEGVLRARDVLNIREKKSPVAGDVMEKGVGFVRDDHSLRHALGAFARTGYGFFVVINRRRETVGILTLRDLMESLLGQKMEDGFDEDDDRAVVAGRKLDSSKGGVDV